jgi:nicotinate-nucleotide pyrophosphorylase (carboxylating)
MLDVPAISGIVSAAVDEDYRDGDITSRLCFPEGQQASAEIVAREALVVCGLEIVDIIIGEFGFEIDTAFSAEDGDVVEPDEVLVELYGPAVEVMAAERTMLNFLQRLCGVATTTAEYVAAAGQLAVLDTRKTLPGWRYLDKYAARVGGARNHRMHLGDMILIKDTHIDAVGGIAEALQAVFEDKPLYMPVEIEVRTIDELEQALAHPVSIVLLDNMDTATLRQAYSLSRAQRPDVQIEISGGVTIERLAELQEFAGAGVSIGALTTQARNRDISMRVVVVDE